MYGRSTMLVQGGMLLVFFFLFSPLWLQLSICAAVLSCSSCHHTSTHPTWKQAPRAAVVTFPVTRRWGTGTFHQPLQTQHHQLLARHCQSWADVFLGVQAETWHLSYTCVQTPLGLYLAQLGWDSCTVTTFAPSWPIVYVVCASQSQV